MRRLPTAALLLWAIAAQANPLWDSLWRTPDQRAEQRLREGRPAEAAQLFRDPRGKAYAELQAGDFARAARDFAAFGDSDSQYNRGNALARAGRLQDAIKAYDAALARDPANRDARHNRDLVAKALQKQTPPQQSASDKGQQKQTGQSGQSGQKKGAGGSGARAGNASQPPSGNGAGQSQSGQDKPGQQGQNPPNQGQPGQHENGGARPGPAGQGQPQVGQANPDRAGAVASGSASAAQQPANDAAQARRDAAAALGQTQPGQMRPGSAQPGQRTVSATGAIGERQLAEEQWLRRIPDDPGGLLRRKFLIEHLIRQQGAQP